MRPVTCLAAATLVASVFLTPASATHEFCVKTTIGTETTQTCDPFPSPSHANCVTQTVTDPVFFEVVTCFPNPEPQANTAR